MTKSARDCALEMISTLIARGPTTFGKDMRDFSAIIQRALDAHEAAIHERYKALANGWGASAKRFDSDAKNIEGSNTFKGKLQARADWLRNCAYELLAISGSKHE